MRRSLTRFVTYYYYKNVGSWLFSNYLNNRRHYVRLSKEYYTYIILLIFVNVQNDLNSYKCIYTDAN